MELWIRSQDKENVRPKLLKISYIELGEYDEQYCLVAENCYNIGIYKSKERALEVLDEIQNILKPLVIFKSDGGAFTTGDNNLHIINPTYEKIEQLDTYVYEMPKE